MTGCCIACGAKTFAHSATWLILCPEHWQVVEKMSRQQAIKQLREWIDQT